MVLIELEAVERGFGSSLQYIIVVYLAFSALLPIGVAWPELNCFWLYLDFGF